MLYGEFQKFGEIVDSIVMKNPETGNSRGFGFVTFKDNAAADSAVAAGTHKIDGKIVSLVIIAYFGFPMLNVYLLFVKVDVKLCNPRLAAQQRTNKQKTDNCKVFVGGLPHGVTDDEIKNFFSRYGTVGVAFFLLLT